MRSLLHSAMVVAGSAAMPVVLSAQIQAAAANSSDDSGPVIQFSTESYDFGKVLAGETVYYTNVVTNTGGATLDISDVKASCSCTVVSWTPHIAPHETGTIPIAIHTSPGTRGQLDKTVTVTSNDKTRTNVTLHVHGLVWMPIEVSPQQMALFTIKPDEESVVPQVLKIFNRTEEPLVLSAPQSSKPEFSAVLTTNVPGQEYELKITAAPPPRNSNARGTTFLQGAITIPTSSTNMPVLTITAMANVQPEIEVLPGQIQVASGPLPNGLTNWISIRGNTTAALTVSDPKVTVSGGSPVFSVEDFKDLSGIINRMRQESDAVSAFLWQSLSNPEQVLLLNYQPSAPGAREAQGIVVQALNKVLASPTFYDVERFRGVPLRPEATEIVKEKSASSNLVRLNRLLLEDSFPRELSQRPSAEAALKVMTPNRAYSLFVSFPKGFEIRPGENVVVSVNTDNPRSPTLTVPVFPMQPVRRPLALASPVAASSPPATKAVPVNITPPAIKTAPGSLTPPMPPTPAP